MSGLLFALGRTGPAHAQAPDETDQARWFDVEVGQSMIYRQDKPIARILISEDSVAEIKLLEEGQFQVRGVSVGSTDLWVWFRDERDNPVRYELTVHRDLSDLIRRIDQSVEGAAPKVYPMLDRIVVEGEVPDVESLERISGISSIYDEEFVNNMWVGGDHQVQLQVVFAEVNRSGLRELGFNTINGGIVASPVAGGFNLVAVAGSPLNFAAIIGVLERNNLSKILARPTLVAMSGQQAEFLAGGELPIPVGGTGGTVSIEFKEYGVKVVFVPTVLGNDIVDLRVYVEVSEVDQGTSLNVTGFEIPGFVSRKSSSHLRLESGMTFAMAGLLNEQIRSSNQKVPVLGDIPIVGALFRNVSHNKLEQELMIFVTPKLVRPLAADEVPGPPGTYENNDPTTFELFALGLDHRIGSRSADNRDDSGPQGPVGVEQ
jgi:pilus assembly protein CpaC